LRLAWWKGNEKLKLQAVEVKVSPPRSGKPLPPAAMIEPAFDPGRGLVLEGTLSLPASPEARPTGLFLGQTNDAGVAILIRAGGATEIGPMRSNGSGFKVEQRVDREWDFGATARFRLLAKGSFLEFYLDDLLMHCYSLPGKSNGRIALLAADDPATAATLKAWHPGGGEPQTP
jgi:hypothetical protein